MMKIKTTSWHYKLLDKFDRNPESKRDFCSYWGSLISLILLIIFISLLILMMYTLFGLATVKFFAVTGFWWNILIFITSPLIAVSVAMIFLVNVVALIEHNNIIWEKYNSWKCTHCPLIEIEKDE